MMGRSGKSQSTSPHDATDSVTSSTVVGIARRDQLPDSSCCHDAAAETRLPQVKQVQSDDERRDSMRKLTTLLVPVSVILAAVLTAPPLRAEGRMMQGDRGGMMGGMMQGGRGGMMGRGMMQNEQCDMMRSMMGQGGMMQRDDSGMMGGRGMMQGSQEGMKSMMKQMSQMMKQMGDMMEHYSDMMGDSGRSDREKSAPAEPEKEKK